MLTFRDVLRFALITAYKELVTSPALAHVPILLLEADRLPDLAGACWEDIFGTSELVLKSFLDKGVAAGDLRESFLPFAKKAKRS